MKRHYKIWWVRPVLGTIIAGATTITSGTGAGSSTAVATGEALFTNLYTLGSPLQSGTQLYLEQGVNTLVPSYWGTGHIDLVLPVQRAGVLINSGNVTVFAREYGNAYNNATVNLAAGGRTPAAISTSVDPYITDSSATIAALTGISLAYATAAHDLNNGNGAKNYDLAINCGGNGIAHVYEWLQLQTDRGQTGTTNTNGVNGQFFQGLTGYTPIASAPFGTFAGTKFFGAQGVWLFNPASADRQNYQLMPNDGSTQIPPNYINLTISSVVAGDQILVARSTGVGSTAIAVFGYTLASAGNSSGSGTVTVIGSIGSDEPQIGTLRIENSAGLYDIYPYTSWTGSEFTLAGTLSATYNGATMFVTLLDVTASSSSATTTLIFNSLINCVIRVRKYAPGAGNSIDMYESPGQITATGMNVSAIRNIDPVAT